MEPWICPKSHFDIRTASSDNPRYRDAEYDPLEAVDFGQRLTYRPQNLERNEDGTVTVDVESRCKLKDEDGFEFYVRDEEMPFDEDRFHEFKGRIFIYLDSQAFTIIL